MSGIDAFLDLFDADPDWDSGEEDCPFERLMKTSSKAEDNTTASEVAKKAAQAKESNGSFQQLFGDPIQIKSKIPAFPKPPENDDSKKGPALKHTPISKPPSQFLPRSESKPSPSPIQPRFLPKPDDSLAIMDPFSKLRLFKNSIQLYYDDAQPLEVSLKDRNLTITFVPLQKLIFNKDKKNIWTVGVLFKRVEGTRKSAKGNDYVLWEVYDLDGEVTWTVFLFGTAATSDGLRRIPIGSLIDFTNPTILEDGGGGGTAKPKLSIANTNQVRHIGTAKDFGFCSSRRKDGQSCTMPVNKFKCDVCIHHASAELKKLNSNGKGKSNKSKSNWAKNNSFPVGVGKFGFPPKVEMGKPDSDGIMVSNFGRPTTGKSSYPSVSASAPSKPPIRTIDKKQLVRMELQDSANMMKRNPTSFGNHENISFRQEQHPMLNLLPKDDRVIERKKLDLNPHTTRHLTEKDRILLEKLESSHPSSDLPNLLALPAAGSQNFLKFLSNYDEKNKSTDTIDYCNMNSKSQPLVMSRETMQNMKKALNFVKKNGPIEKKDPNSTAPAKKRKLDAVDSADQNKPCSSGSLTKKSNSSDSNSENLVEKVKAGGSGNGSKSKIEIEIDMSSDEFKQLLNAKSSHADFLEETQEGEYFSKLERKEAIENKLLSTFHIPTSAVMCRECKYVALSQSGFCKEKRHLIRIVKANKRFFKCKDCGNRTMSLDRLPKRREPFFTYFSFFFHLGRK